MRKQFSLFAKAMLAVLALAGVSKVSRGDSCSVPSYLSTVDWGEYWEWYCDDWWGEEWTDESGWVPYLICEDCIDCRWLPVGWWAEDLIEVPNTVAGHPYQFTLHMTYGPPITWTEIGNGESLCSIWWYEDCDPAPLWVSVLEDDCVILLPDDPTPTPIRPPGQNLFSFPSSALLFSFTRAEFEVEVGNRLGRVLSDTEKQILNSGCIGVATIACNHRFIFQNGRAPVEAHPEPKPEDNGGSRNNPDVVGVAKAFLTLAQAVAGGCGPGTRTVIFAKYGAWKNGVAPLQVQGGDPGEIPVDSVVAKPDGTYNYVTLIGGKWLHMDHGIDPNHPEWGEQLGWTSSEPPEQPPPESQEKVMWVRRCVPNDKIVVP